MTQQGEYERLLKRVAKNIKTLRLRAELTQMDMVDHGFNYRHYQRIESGEAGYNLLTLFRLSKVFKVKIESFFD